MSAATSLPPTTHDLPGQAPDMMEPDDREPPPVYSMVANPTHGESTVEYGPTRPFQPSAIRVQNVAAQVDPEGEVSYVSPPPRTPAGPTSRFAPPPRHPSIAPTIYAPPTGPPPSRVNVSTSPQRPQSRPHSRNISDFASDFYNAGTGEPPLASSSSTSNVYAPPLGPPPGPSNSIHRHPSPPSLSSAPPPPAPPRSSSDFPGSGSAEVPDDGRPTTHPVPGHPLLYNNKILVFPAGYECYKCSNTGYKHYDPSHPCEKCWSKHSKPYSGPITYAPLPSSSPASIPNSSGKTFQRPLPKFAPAGSSNVQTQSPFGANGYPGLQRNRTVSTPLSAGPGLGLGRYPSTFQPRETHRVVSNPYNNNGYAQAGPATVVAPGDPRIGGMTCWRCSGRGVTSVLFFDRETCSVCGGVGRVF